MTTTSTRKRFEDSAAIVTGAASGLGRAIALQLGSEGARVACLDLAAEAAASTAAQIAGGGGDAAGYEVDIADPASVGKALASAATECGRPSLLINCAGTGKFAHSHEMPLAEWSRIIAVNLTGTFIVSQAVLRYMLEAGGGSIVNIASSAGLKGQAYGAAYCASKGGIIQLTRALADEYLTRGIRINAVAPGFMDTPSTDAFRVPEGASQRAMAKMITPLGKSSPEEVANVVVFIASSEARYMTGSVISIDGGLTI